MNSSDGVLESASLCRPQSSHCVWEVTLYIPGETPPVEQAVFYTCHRGPLSLWHHPSSTWSAQSSVVTTTMISSVLCLCQLQSEFYKKQKQKQKKPVSSDVFFCKCCSHLACLVYESEVPRAVTSALHLTASGASKELSHKIAGVWSGDIEIAWIDSVPGWGAYKMVRYAHQRGHKMEGPPFSSEGGYMTGGQLYSSEGVTWQRRDHCTLLNTKLSIFFFLVLTGHRMKSFMCVSTLVAMVTPSCFIMKVELTLVTSMQRSEKDKILTVDLNPWKPIESVVWLTISRSGTITRGVCCKTVQSTITVMVCVPFYFLLRFGTMSLWSSLCLQAVKLEIGIDEKPTDDDITKQLLIQCPPAAQK